MSNLKLITPDVDTIRLAYAHDIMSEYPDIAQRSLTPHPMPGMMYNDIKHTDDWKLVFDDDPEFECDAVVTVSGDFSFYLHNYSKEWVIDECSRLAYPFMASGLADSVPQAYEFIMSNYVESNVNDDAVFVCHVITKESCPDMRPYKYGPYIGSSLIGAEYLGDEDSVNALVYFELVPVLQKG